MTTPNAVDPNVVAELVEAVGKKYGYGPSDDFGALTPYPGPPASS